MRIDATGRLSHYVDHLAPTWLALPEDERGTFWVPEGLVEHAARRGVEAEPYRGQAVPWEPGDGPLLVAAWQDQERAKATGRPVAYQGHGVGQAFGNPDGTRRRHYSGGEGFEAVRLFLAANERHAALWRTAYPAAETVVVGCPKLGGRSREGGPRGTLVVASFHFPAVVPKTPEANTAWRDYRAALPELARHFDFALHSHPRFRKVIRAEAQRIGVPFIEDFAEVLDRAAVYLNDASSTLWEFAAFGGPVVVLNSPRFRRDVHHGLRFWDCADVGPQVNHRRELVAAVRRALADPPDLAARRREIAAELYQTDDPAERAAAALLALTRAPALA